MAITTPPCCHRKAPWLLSPQPFANVTVAFLLSSSPRCSPSISTPFMAHLSQGRAPPVRADGPRGGPPAPTCLQHLLPEGWQPLQLSLHHAEHGNPTLTSPTAFPTPAECTLLLPGSRPTSMGSWPSPNLSPISTLTRDPASTAEPHLPALSPHQSCLGQITERVS